MRTDPKARDREDAERLRMAALTGLCLAGWLAGFLGGRLGIVPDAGAAAAFATAYLAGGYYTTRKALAELAGGTVGVDLLMILAALGAAAVGELPEGAFLLFLFSLSNTLEQVVLGRTRRAIEKLLALSPAEATVLRDGGERRVPVEELRVGDVLLVRPGERLAADGVVRAGHTSLDQSAMTGESIPVEKTVGDPVFAGTLNQRGGVEVRVTRLAADTTLARVVQMVEVAQSEKAQSQRFTAWFGSRYTLAVLGMSLVTFLVAKGLLDRPWGAAFYQAMTVLVVASPCAVVISIPAAILAAITCAARNGVLFKGGAHLEQAADLRAFAFDKTGTLTVGKPRLVELLPAEGVEGNEVLRLAASAESLSEHPLAGAVVEAAKERGLDLLPAANLEALVGRGVRADLGGRPVWVGKAELFTGRGVPIPDRLGRDAEGLAATGKTTLYVGDRDRVLGVLAVADTLRPSAPKAITRLRELGIRHMVLVTGDNRVVAEAIAGQLGLRCEAELLPEDKVRVLKQLRQEHGAVGMIGDGINDAPSLAAASLGLTLGPTGTDVALETADVVLMGDDLLLLPYAVALARQTTRIIRQNLVFAFAVMAILLTAAFFGALRLPLAVVGHEGSTALVIFNGLRLLTYSRQRLEERRATS